MGNFSHIDFENEKVKRIAISALEVFSNNDYDKASTNMIVKKAGVPRGVLYYYFRNKEELFEYLIYQSQVIFILETEKSVDWENLNFINRYKKALYDKLEVMRVYPYMLDFLNKYRSHVYSKKIKTEFESDYSGFRDKLYCQNIDFDVVKEGVDFKEMVNIVRWTTKGMMQELIDNQSVGNFNEKMDSFKDEFCSYMDIIERQFYK